MKRCKLSVDLVKGNDNENECSRKKNNCARRVRQVTYKNLKLNFVIFSRPELMLLELVRPLERYLTVNFQYEVQYNIILN